MAPDAKEPGAVGEFEVREFEILNGVERKTRLFRGHLGAGAERLQFGILKHERAERENDAANGIGRPQHRLRRHLAPPRGDHRVEIRGAAVCGVPRSAGRPSPALRVLYRITIPVSRSDPVFHCCPQCISDVACSRLRDLIN
jgi:hypothetical protein